MFGKRFDGKRLKGIDPIIALTPYIMPHRNDSQVFTRQDLDFDEMTRYIRDQRKAGHTDITYMSMLVAAYLRTICQYPTLNRFVVNKKLYARNHFCISFVTLRKTVDDSIEEALCKVQFNLTDTIYDVSRRLAEAIEEGRKPAVINKTDKVARLLASAPLLPDLVVAIARVLDNHGLLPRILCEASPFHTSLFVSNMASIGMTAVYHHIYDFGTTSVFVTMGRSEQKISANSDGTCRSKRVMPLGVTIDERIASGGEYARFFSVALNYLHNPSLLEKAPDIIKTETEMIEATDHLINA